MAVDASKRLRSITRSSSAGAGAKGSIVIFRDAECPVSQRYSPRIAELEKVTYPKPNAELVYGSFNDFAVTHPWVKKENIRPKSIARDMVDSGQWFLPRRGPEFYAEKPPVFLWLQAAMQAAMQQAMGLY